MGLGKTLQALALIGVSEMRIRKVNRHWLCACKSGGKLDARGSALYSGMNVLKHHGPKRAKESVVLEDVDLVITSMARGRMPI